jgi:ribosomal protein S10
MKNIIKYQIKIESVDQKSLALYKVYLKTLLKLKKIESIFFNLPLSKKKFTFLKSPHVNKKHKEHFFLYKYKLLCVFFDTNEQKCKNIFYYKPTTLKIKIIKEK